MVYIYYSQGVSSQYQDFTERLMSHLALKGTEITNQLLKPASAMMDVKHTDEKGKLDIVIESENIKVIYTVERGHKEISNGVMGAIAGAGLGGVIGNILRKDSSARDAITGAIGGAAAGGAYEAYHGWEESKNGRTDFAAVLAATIHEVEDELQNIIQGQEEALRISREQGRQKLQEESSKTEEYSGLLEELYGQILALQEEIDLAKSEGVSIIKPKARIDRAEKLYQEAQASLEKKEYSSIKPKITAARDMVDKAKEAMSGAGT